MTKINIITSEESKQRLIKEGYGWEGRMVLRHRCDWEFWPKHFQNDPNVTDFVLAYNAKQSERGLERLDMYVKRRSA